MCRAYFHMRYTSSDIGYSPCHSKIFGPTKERDGTWRIKKRWMRWINKIQECNKSHKTTTIKVVWPFTSNGGRENSKKIYNWKRMSVRPQGRPKNRWEDDIRNDMEKLKIKNWISCIQDRKKLKSYVEMVKTFKVLNCSAWRRRPCHSTMFSLRYWNGVVK